jgi:hypothetical protein
MEPRHPRIARRRFIASLVLCHLVIATVHATGTLGLGEGRTPDGIEASLREPHLEGRLSARDAFFLKIAFREAVQKLARKERCRALFDDLGLDGLQALDRSRYRPVRSAADKEHCTSGVFAYTAVGQDRIMLCRRFHSLDEGGKVAVLIHEALHTAGMGEAPSDPAGMTSEAINEMIQKACGCSPGTTPLGPAIGSASGMTSLSFPEGSSPPKPSVNPEPHVGTLS